MPTAEPPGAELFVFDPDELDADRHRRGRRLRPVRLALPRVRRPGAAHAAHATPRRRSPLWQQRQRSAQLLEVARRYPTFPIILETLREVLQDVYDVPALLRIARAIGERRIRLVETERRPAVAVRPRSALRLRRRVHVRGRLARSPNVVRPPSSVDPALLCELLGKIEMRELLDPEVIAQFEREAQRLDPERRARGVEGVADLLRMLGPLDAAEVAAATPAGRGRRARPGGRTRPRAPPTSSTPWSTPAARSR